MIDLSQAIPCSTPVSVEASNKLFDELGNNTYDYKDLLSELIDNSIAARIPDQPLKVDIDIFTDANDKAVKFVIRDNASGISAENLGNAISPAGIQTQNSLNEHGLGMKQAVAALGKLEYLATRTRGEEQARLIKEFRFGDIPMLSVPFGHESGTEIGLINIKPTVITNSMNYTRTIVPYLGARYRRFLKPDNRVMDLTINIREANGSIKYTHPVYEVKPIYFHPSERVKNMLLNHIKFRETDGPQN
jgi:hypothetical protein